MPAYECYGHVVARDGPQAGSERFKSRGNDSKTCGPRRAGLRQEPNPDSWFSTAATYGAPRRLCRLQDVTHNQSVGASSTRDGDHDNCLSAEKTRCHRPEMLDMSYMLLNVHKT